VARHESDAIFRIAVFTAFRPNGWPNQIVFNVYLFKFAIYE
jgi:hypothetical protein